MGKGDSSTSELPMSLKVKNTFIDVNSSFVEDDWEGDDGAFLQSIITKRQFSAPVESVHRQFSAGTFPRVPGENLQASPVSTRIPDGLLEEEEPELDDGGEWEEPEMEKDPCWNVDFQLGRQETELAWPVRSAGNDEAEQAKSPWGSNVAAAKDFQAGVGQQRGGGLWLFSVPSQDALPAYATDAATGPYVADVGAYAADADTGPYAADAGASGAGYAAAPYWPAPQANPMAPNMASGGKLVPPPEWANVSTVMMRNLPNKYSQQMILEELNSSGFMGTFDFIYLPIDPETNANRGYAFINFTDPSFAWMLKSTYEGRKMGHFNSDKVVSVAAAALQGFEANYAHYSTARVNRGDPAARPLFLRESSMKNFAPKNGGRRRGGRRNAGSLVDAAARGQSKQAAGLGAFELPRHVQVPPGSNPGPWAQPSAGAPPAPARADTDGGEGPRFCPYCGGGCQPQFRFCRFCGASLALPQH